MVFPVDVPCVVPPTQNRDSHHKKKPEDHIKRPRNAFFIFRAEFIRANRGFLEKVEKNHANYSRVAGNAWQSMSPAEKEPWNELAKQEAEEHKSRYSKYNFVREPVRVADPETLKRKRKVKVGRDEETLEKTKTRCKELAKMIKEGQDANHPLPHLLLNDDDEFEIRTTCPLPSKVRRDTTDSKKVNSYSPVFHKRYVDCSSSLA